TFTPEQPCSDFQTARFLRGSKLKIQFLLFGSSNASCGQLALTNEDVRNSSFNTSLDTKIIIHGFRAMGTKPSWVEGLARTLLRAAEVNVIAVDWIHGSTTAYPTAVENVIKLALEISHFISKLLVGVRFSSEKSIHLIGVSLGAQVAGLVGQFYQGQLGRITGLDPAGPKYTRASREERLDPGDAHFVEAIHTDTDNLGIRIPVGHIDYYVNGGKDQPGSHPTFLALLSLAVYRYLICDHMRAVHLYISALEDDACPLMAFPCSSHEDFLAGHCLDCSNPFLRSCPRIGKAPGERSLQPLPQQAFVGGSFDLGTSLYVRNCCDCMRHSVTLSSRPKQQTKGKAILAHPAPLCQIESVSIQYIPKNRMWRKKDETSISGKFCTAPLPVNNSEKMFCLSQRLTLMSNRPISHDLSVVCA
uniref:Phospholipase A1 member A n=1 Tax=Sphenodon punctatus TaxID=8508 RepID=A0A8D0HLF3_SPHPU